ncbi:MAG: hypothetical protein ACYDH0_13400 [Candidatus Aminicenantales bacterium]
MIGAFNCFVSGFFDLVFLPFRGLGPWAGMIVVSLLTSFLMLFIFRRTSNQAGIRKAKNRIKAHLLELRLFSDSLSVSMKAQRRILAANLGYVGYNAKPMLVMIVPGCLILIQLNLRYGAESLRPGEPALVKVRLAGDRLPSEVSAALESSSLIEVETPPLRIDDEREIDWRVRARESGRGRLILTIGGEMIAKDVAVRTKPLTRISGIRVGGNLIDQFFNPGESPLPRSSAVESVEIRYAPARLLLFGRNVHWLVAYFVLSVAFGFAFKGVFKVEI